MLFLKVLDALLRFFFLRLLLMARSQAKFTFSDLGGRRSIVEWTMDPVISSLV